MLLAIISAIILAVTFIRELVLVGLLGLGAAADRRQPGELGAAQADRWRRARPTAAPSWRPCDVMTAPSRRSAGGRVTAGTRWTMGISTAPGQMTSEEIVRLSREHTFFSWSAQGAIDPIAIDRAEGVYLYTPEGQPDPRLQQPADVGQHRPRRPAGHRRDHRAGDEAPVRPAGVRDGAAARLGAKLAEILPGDLDKVFLTLGGAEAIENAIKLARALHRPPQDPRPLPRLPRRDARGDDADRRPAPLGQRAGPRRRRPLPGHAPLGREGAAARRRRRSRASRTSSATRARTRSPRSSSRRSSARTAS